MSMMEITTNKDIDNNTLNIVKTSFEEQKDISVLSIYHLNDIIYGIYVNNPRDSLSYSHQPLLDMHTDIDGHDIFFIELGNLLHFIYAIGSTQMFLWLTHPSAIDCSNDYFNDLVSKCSSNPPLKLSSLLLIKLIDDMNDDNLDMDINDLVLLSQYFMQIEPLNIYVNEEMSEALKKNRLNQIKQELMMKEYDNVSELMISEIDELYVQIQLTEPKWL